MLDVRSFGAVGDGIHDDTHAIRRALEACRAAGGGVISIAGGDFKTAPLELCSNVVLRVEAGARLLFSDKPDDFPPRRVRWEGVECFGFMPCLYGWELENVTLEGRGVIDGQGMAWWAERRRKQQAGVTGPETDGEKELARLNGDFANAGSGGGGRELQFLRPCLVELLHCRNVTLRDLTLCNSPFWNTHLVYCEDVTVDSLHIRNPAQAPNGDGLSLDSCRFVRVSNCDIDAGDDCLTLKSGIDADGRRVGRPTEDVVISNCVFRRGHGGVVFGSEISGGIRRIAVSNCVFHETDRGIRIKARRGRGGYVEDVRISNVIMTDVSCPVVINAAYVCGAKEGDAVYDAGPRPVDETTPRFERIHIAQLTARNCRSAAGFLCGLPEMPLRDLRLEDVHIETVTDGTLAPKHAAMAVGVEKTLGTGLRLRHACGVRLRGVALQCLHGPAYDVEQVEDFQQLP